MALRLELFPICPWPKLVEAARAKSDQRGALWRYVDSIALVVATVGVATEIVPRTR